MELDDYNRQEAANLSSGATDEERFVQEMLSDEVSPEQGIAQAEALGVCFEQVIRQCLAPACIWSCTAHSSLPCVTPLLCVFHDVCLSLCVPLRLSHCVCLSHSLTH